MTIVVSVGLAFAAIIGVCLFVLWYGSATVINKQGDTIAEHTEQLATLAYQMPALLEFLGVEIPEPAVNDSPAALLAEPHLSSLPGGSEDFADLFPRRSAGLGVPSLSGDFTTQRGVEDLQGVQGVQLTGDVAEVVRQPVEDRGTEFVTDRLVVPVGDHVVAEDVPQPAEGFTGAVVPGGVVVDGESGDRHAVKGGLTASTCQDGFDVATDEFPALPATEPDGIAIQVQSALLRPSPVPRDLSGDFPHPVDSDERKAQNAADIEERLKQFDFSGRDR